MADDATLLKHTAGMPARERAAAIAHTIYIIAGQTIPGWQIRVPTEWQDLSPDAKAINLAAIDAWAKARRSTESLARCRAVGSEIPGLDFPLRR